MAGTTAARFLIATSMVAAACTAVYAEPRQVKHRSVQEHRPHAASKYRKRSIASHGSAVFRPTGAYGSAQTTADWSDSGAIVNDATQRAQSEPGVTSELAPDSKQTATGGPVGGVPGYDGS